MNHESLERSLGRASFLACLFLLALLPWQTQAQEDPGAVLKKGIAACQALSGWKVSLGLTTQRKTLGTAAEMMLKQGGAAHPAFLSITLERFDTVAAAASEFDSQLGEISRNGSATLLEKDFGVGSRSILYRLSAIGQPDYWIKAAAGNWYVSAMLHNRRRGNSIDDAAANAIVKSVGKAVFGQIGARPEPPAPGDCGKAGGLTRYLEALRRHRQDLSSLNGELGSRLNGAKADRQAVIHMGGKALAAAADFQKTLKAFIAAETRRGLLEEIDLILDSVQILNQVVEKYHGLAGTSHVPLTKNALANAKADVAGTLLRLFKEKCSSRLESEGLRDILTSASWNEALDKASYHSQRKLDEFLERETEKVFGFGFHDVESARRALRIQMRREICRQVAKLLVKITSNEIIIEIIAGPIIRWLEGDLLPRLREALRQKGNLANRLVRSKETMANASLELNRLACDSKLIEVKRRLAAANGVLHATRFLERDLSGGNWGNGLFELAAAKEDLTRTMNLTRVRFLLVKDDYEENLAFADLEVDQLLRNLRAAIPSPEGGGGGSAGSDQKKLRMKGEIAVAMGREIPDHDARVTGLRFFGSGSQGTAPDQRRYGSRFSRVETRFINWEMSLDHQLLRTKAIYLEGIFFKPDGGELGRVQGCDLLTYTDYLGTASVHSRGLGWETPGNWPAGKYRVVVYIRNMRVAAGEFEIF